MDDLEFRRRAYAEPDCQSESFLQFKNKSPENTRFVDELLQMDGKLKQALCVQPPDNLVEKIKLKQTFSDHHSSRERWHFLSFAASILLALVLTFYYLPIDYLSVNYLSMNYLSMGNSDSERQLKEGLLQHVYSELDHLDEQQNPSLSQVNTLLAEFGGSMDRLVAEVSYLGSCEIHNTTGVHMVVKGDRGPVTIMLLRGVTVNSQKLISDQRFRGLIVPADKGSIAIIGEKGESLQSIKNKLLQQVHWI